MGRFLSLPILALAAILGSTVLVQVRIYNGQPDLVFLLVLAWSLHAPLPESVVWAFVGGIAQDLLSAAPLGASVIGLLLTVFGIDALRSQFFGVGLLGLVGMTIVGTVVGKAAWLAAFALAGFPVRPQEFALYTVLPTLAYNLVFILPVYWALRRIQRRAAPSDRFSRE